MIEQYRPDHLVLECPDCGAEVTTIHIPTVSTMEEREVLVRQAAQALDEHECAA
jgi:hypothetical protein